MKVLLILNPAAGRGKAVRVCHRLKREIERRKIDHHIVTTMEPGHAGLIAAEMQSDYDIVACVGGDGTAREIAESLVGSRSALAVIPVGSGNDFARSAGWIGTPEGFADALTRNRTRTIDTGIVRFRSETEPAEGLRFFLNVVGVGFDAAVAYRSHRIRWLRSTVLYTAALLLTLPAFQPPVMRIEVDGDVSEGAFYIATCGNGRFEGGGFEINPDADIADGMLDLCTVARLGKLRLLGLFPTVLWGGHRRFPEVSLRRVRSFTVTSQTPVVAHADGEILGADVTGLSVEVRPSSLRLLEA